jgi:hypothetical protein
MGKKPEMKETSNGMMDNYIKSEEGEIEIKSYIDRNKT